MLSWCKVEVLRVRQSECALPDLLCITRPRCTDDIMMYKRKRVEKIPPLHLHWGERQPMPFEEERGFKKKKTKEGASGRGRGKKPSTRP